MNVVLLRVGIDTGSGGIHGPLFEDGTFEYIPIPDRFEGRGVDSRTYENVKGRMGRPLIEYFPERRRLKMAETRLHLDPEFVSFTYGDPTSSSKRGLRNLQRGDFLVFYAGLQGFDHTSEPALYIIGYFEIQTAGLATDYTNAERHEYFAENFHVRHERVFRRQEKELVLVKGSSNSRLLEKAVQISEWSHDRSGRRLKVLSKDVQEYFGNFGGKISIQRCPPRWVSGKQGEKAAVFVRGLE